MTEAEIKHEIKRIVKIHGMLTGPAIVADLGKHNCVCDIPSLLDEMVAAKELLLLEYMLPTNMGRLKSLFFPAGTLFNTANLENVEIPY